MNNNNNNVSGMVNDTLLITSLKSVVRDIVREELMLQGIPVNDPKPQFTANYDTGTMMQNTMSATNGINVNDVCIDYRRRNLKHCNTCFAGNNCLARFETKTFDVNEFNRRYNGAILEGMTIRQFFNLPEVRKFKGNRTDADIASVIFFKDLNTFVGVKDIKDDVVLMDLHVSYIINRTFPDNKIVIYVDVTGFTKDESIFDNHDGDNCSSTMADTCIVKKEEAKEVFKGKKYKDLKDFGLFDLMPNGFNLYLDDEDIVEDDDSTQALLNYDFSNDCYTLTSNSAIKITRDDLLKCTITGIGSDISDFSVPAVWIKPDENWYKKREQYSELTSALINVTNKKYAIEKALMKADAADAADNAKPKSRRKSTK